MKTDSKKKISVKNRKRSFPLGSFLFDAAILIIVFALSLIDSLVLKKSYQNYEELFNKSSASMILILIPSIITVLSVSLSMNKENIYGATLKEIGRLRNSFYFSFLHMILVMCIDFFVFSLFEFFDLRITIYGLGCISFVYSCIFSIQEIPILMRSKRVVSRILRKRYLTSRKNNGPFENEESNIFNSIITNIILSEGIDSAFSTLYKDEVCKTDLLGYLICLQSQYFEESIENLPIEKSFRFDAFKDISITKVIDEGYKNISDLLIDETNNNLQSLLTKDRYYQIAHSVHCLHVLCSILKTENKEKKELGTLLSHIALFHNKEIQTHLSWIICLTATTLNEGDTWFITLMRDNSNYPTLIFNYEMVPLGVFFCMIISHIFAKKTLNEEQRNTVESFLDEPTNGNNSDGFSFKEHMRKSIILYGKTTQIVDSIGLFLNYFDSVPESVFYFHGTRKRPFYDADEDFTKGEVFHCWLLLVFASMYYNGSDSVNLKEKMISLSAEDQKVLAEELSDNWLFGGKLKDDIDLSFLNFFGITEGIYKNSYFNDSLVSQIIEFHDFYYKGESFNRQVDDNLVKARNAIITKFNNSLNVKQMPFIDTQLNVDNEQTQYFSVIIETENCLSLLNPYLDQLSYGFMEMIERFIIENVKSIETDSYEITDDMAVKIVELEPNFTSSIYKIQAYLTKENASKQKEIKNLNLKSISGLALDLYWKAGAIKFNAKLKQDDSTLLIRELTKEELEEKIDKEYKPSENGLYRYSDNNDDKKHDFYVTREELLQKLVKRVRYVCIPFKSKIVLKKQSILRFEMKQKMQ